MPEEIWKDIKDYEGLYQISDKGRVKALSRIYTTGQGATRRHDDLIMVPHPNGNGYMSVVLYKNGRGKTCRVHRLVMAAFGVPSCLEINHKNGIKADNAFENLEYCTRSENIKHAYNSGLIKFRKEQRGENNHAAKLRTADVKEIRHLCEKLHIKQKDVARKFGVSPVTVNDILKRRKWAHV